jgi:phage baseplate assembly protein W
MFLSGGEDMANSKLGVDIALDGGLSLLFASGSNDLKLSQTGDVSRIDDLSNVRQALIKRLNTRKGELWAHPEYGCGIWDILSEPMTDTWFLEALATIREAINDDPRSSVLGVTYEAVPQERYVIFTITYQVLDGRQDNLTWDYAPEEVTDSV